MKQSNITLGNSVQKSYQAAKTVRFLTDIFCFKSALSQ